MWSRIKNLGLAWKLTLSDAVVFLLVLFFTSLIIMSGLYFSTYHQAEVAMKIATNNLHDTLENPDIEMLREMQRVTAKLWLDERKFEPVLEETMEGPRGLPLFTMLLARQGKLPPGLVMRVVRNHDRALVYDTSPMFPKNREIEENLTDSQPFWGTYAYPLAEMPGDVRMFFHRELIDWGMVSYTVYFIYTVPIDHAFMRTLGLGLVLLDLFGVLLAMVLCHRLTRRALQPLQVITSELQKIEIGQMERRVTVPGSRDEIFFLASSVNHMLTRLEQGVNREQRFVSDASHELRTPLSIILGHAGMLCRWGQEDKAMLKEGLETIYDEAGRMSTLVQRLLELARADQKRLKLNPEIVDLGELVENVYREMLPVLSADRLVLQENEAGFVEADVDTIHELLLILLDNARKYTPEGGTISLFSLRENNEMHFGVRDTGEGIAKEDLAHIFERFYRVDNARTRHTGGAGLGLALAQQLAIANGGRLVAESKVGEGTCMHVYMPLLELE